MEHKAKYIELLEDMKVIFCNTNGGIDDKCIALLEQMKSISCNIGEVVALLVLILLIMHQVRTMVQ